MNEEPLELMESEYLGEAMEIYLLAGEICEMISEKRMSLWQLAVTLAMEIDCWCTESGSDGYKMVLKALNDASEYVDKKRDRMPKA
jgi:hypothetical protein